MAENGFDTFYAAQFRRLTSQLCAYLGDVAEAQDVVQEAFARAWQRWPSVRDHPDPQAWLRLTATRIAVSWWRRRRSRSTAYRLHGPPDPVAEPDPIVLDLVAAMGRLPPEQRVTLTLHYLAGLPITAIAGELGVAVGTVKARLSRGRTALGALMKVETADA